MVQRISAITPLPGYMLSVLFDDGRRVLYDVKNDIKQLPGYRPLEDVAGLFEQVQLDESRTCVFWNDEIDLPSHAIYEYGNPMPISQQIAQMVEILPEIDQVLALEIVRKLVLAWDHDFTKATPEEHEAMEQAIKELDAGEDVTDDQINWD